MNPHVAAGAKSKGGRPEVQRRILRFLRDNGAVDGDLLEARLHLTDEEARWALEPLTRDEQIGCTGGCFDPEHIADSVFYLLPDRRKNERDE